MHHIIPLVLPQTMLRIGGQIFYKQYKHTYNSFTNRICGIDTNQKHGPTNPQHCLYSTLFGPVGSVERAHSNFDCFLEFCTEFGETPINTHHVHCDGKFIANPYTYIHKHSWELSMIDYLTVSGNIQIRPSSCHRNEHLVLSCICDHIPLGTYVSILPSQQPIFESGANWSITPNL